MYESPIEIIQKNIEMQVENGIYKAVQNVGISVNKEELIKAINYDRRQYQKGYADGFWDAHINDVIRCKDCKQWKQANELNPENFKKCIFLDRYTNAYFYCAYGEKKNEVEE